MTPPSGQKLDEAIGYLYVAVPNLVPADVLDYVDRSYLRWRRPRLASYEFSSLLRTPVHDLPHDGVGVFALHKTEWLSVLSDVAYRDVQEIWAVAVEQW